MENNVTKIAAQLKTRIKATGTPRIRRSAFPLEIQHRVSPRKYSINRIKKTNKQTNKQNKKQTQKNWRLHHLVSTVKLKTSFFLFVYFFPSRKRRCGGGVGRHIYIIQLYFHLKSINTNMWSGCVTWGLFIVHQISENGWWSNLPYPIKTTQDVSRAKLVITIMAGIVQA